MNHFIQRKNTNKKARSLDKVPKLRAFPAFSYLSDNCFWKRTSQMIQCTPEKQRPANKSQPLKLKKQKKFSERKKDTTKRLPEQPKKFLAGRQP